VNENGKVAKKRTVGPNMHALVVFVQMGLQGERRYKVAKIKTETQVDIACARAALLHGRVVLVTTRPMPTLILPGSFSNHERVNHSRQFVNAEGMHTNLAEGFFSCVRRAQAGACIA